MSDSISFPEKKTGDIASQVSAGSVPPGVLQSFSDEEIEYLSNLLGHGNASLATEVHDKEFQILLAGLAQLNTEEAREIVQKTLKEHESDRNFPVELRAVMEEALAENDEKVVEDGITDSFTLRACAAIMRFSSPYPDVRANSSVYDDPDAYCETFRAYMVGIIWVAVSTFVNQFFAIRRPHITLPSGLLQLFAVPSGYLLSLILPDWGFTLRGTRHSLNPGPWSYKEQSIVTIMFGITANLAYVDTQILVQKLPIFYDNQWAGAGYQICMLLSTQFLGFGLAGIFRNVIVYPTQNLFMNNFPSLALNKAFLDRDNSNLVNGWRLTRWKFFGIVFGATFLWQWIPAYLMTFLSTFNWMTWIAPKNFNLAAITGSVSGLGFNPINTFDWSNINYTPPLQMPFFSYANFTVGGILTGFVIIAIYYTNSYNTGYLPINSVTIFTNSGKKYDVKKILTNNVLDPEKYQKYSPPYYSAGYLVYYGAYFSLYTCIFVTYLLYDFAVFVSSMKHAAMSLVGKGKTLNDFDDPDARLMRKYKETPAWWFFVILLLALGLGLATIKAFPTETPVWSLFMALGLSVVFLVPIAMLYARTNNLMSTNVLSELLIGYAKPGHGTAMMLIKAFATNTGMQACYFMSDLKLGHYAKIPPRSVYRVQIIATIVQAFVILGVCQFQLHNIRDICSPSLSATTKFTCPSENSYFSASVFWGVIGPKRVFEGQYPVLKWCFLVGCFIPIPLYLVRLFFPRLRKLLLHVEPNTMLIGAHNTYAPYNFSYIISGFYMNFAFMFFVRKRYTKWFEKYNYVLAAALTAGTALCALIVFFAVQYHPKPLKWWGNTVSYAGADDKGGARLPLPASGYFGAGPGNYYY